MRKRTTKSLLAIVMTAVLVFGMAAPGFAVYGDGGNGYAGHYADGATEGIMPLNISSGNIIYMNDPM